MYYTEVNSKVEISGRSKTRSWIDRKPTSIIIQVGFRSSNPGSFQLPPKSQLLNSLQYNLDQQVNTKEKRRIIFDIYIFRCALAHVDSILEAVSVLEGKTKYRRLSFREEAPEVTDCLTSIHYIFKRAFSIDIPITFVGDMPRELLIRTNFHALKINLKDARCGDILFVSNKENLKLINHTAIILDSNKIFHCSLSLGTAMTQSEETFFKSYEQKGNFQQMAHYIDNRNHKLREKHKGAFISD